MKKLVNESLNSFNESRVSSIGKTEKILQFIEDAGDEGRRYTDIIKFAYELSHGKGSYSNEDRGYWSGAFKTPTRDDRRFGHLMKYIIKADNGNWVLRDSVMTPEEEEEYSETFDWPGKTDYKKRNYPARKPGKKEKMQRTPMDQEEYFSKRDAGEDVSGYFPWTEDED